MKRPLPRSRTHGFTLIEMLTVMLIIAILAGLVLGVSGLVNSKAARARAEGEIKTLGMGCENYKIDFGTVPRNEDTDKLDPRADGNPATGASATKYQKSTLFLYSALNGDEKPLNNPDFVPEGKVYLQEFFKPNVLSAKKDSNGKITQVNFIQDPYGHSYGYSTKGAKAEEEFLTNVRKDSTISRPEAEGYNSTFDLWSTGGSVSGVTAKETGKWIKNW